MAQPEQDPIYDDQKREPTSALDKARARWGMSNDENTPEVEGESQQTSGEKSSARDRADKRWGMGTAGVGNEEAQASPLAGNGLPGVMNGGERELSSVSPPINTTRLSAPGKGKKILFRIRGVGVSRRQAGGAVGGVAGLGLLIAMYMAGASLYLVHLKEYVTGANNIYDSTVSTRLQRRRINSAFKILNGASAKIQTAEFASKARSAGFTVETTSTGKIKSLKKGEAVLEAGVSSREFKKQLNALTTSVDGQDFLNAFNKIAPEKSTRVAGPLVKRNLLKKILGIPINVNWIDNAQRARAGPDGTVVEELSPRADFSNSLLSADETTNEFIKSLDPAEAAAAGLVDPADPPANIDDIAADTLKEADAYKKSLLGDQAAGIVKDNTDNLDKVLANVTDLETALGAGKAVKTDVIKAAASKLGTRVAKKVAGVVAKAGADFSTLPREACRTVGTLDFVKSVKVTLAALLLAKFAVQFYTISDFQKAGLATATSVKLMSIYLEGATGSSGIQSLVKGTPVSTSGLSKYGTGYADIGILASIAAFMRKIPGLEPQNCKIAVSWEAQFVGTVTGGALAAITGGGSAAAFAGASFGLSIALTVVNEVAHAIILPILIGSVSGALINGYESNEDAGTALASAVGSFSMMTSGFAGALPISNAAYADATEETNLLRETELSSRSFADRYFDMSSSDSLIARASLSMPQSLPGIGSIAQNQLKLSSIISPFNSLLSGFSKSANAASFVGLDSAATKYNIATNGFGTPVLAYVPILDLDQTEKILRDTNQINLAGKPIPGTTYHKFIENCFSGRPGVLHPREIKTDGTSDPDDPTCVVNAMGEDSEFTGNFDGDVAEEVEDGKPERIPLKKERMAAWYGFKEVDEENLPADINNQLSGTGSTIGEANNNNIFFLGDSLTVGMQNLAGSDPQSNYLQRSFNSEGWSASVDAKGCRAVYQTQGSFEGDGSSCPAGTINDGISAVNDPVNAQYLNNDEAGTVVIGLGTNLYETDANGRVSQQLFEEKVKLLVSDIRKKSPNAEIYWVNLVNNSESTALQERNLLLNKIAVEDDFTVLDWNDYVSTAKSTPTTEDDVGFATEDRNEVHHTADGYTKKVQYLIDNVILPAGNTVAGTKSLNCSGYKEVTSPESRVDRAYSAEIQNTCEEMKTKCQSGVADTERILCSAFEFDGTYYGNSYGAYSGANGNEIYGFNVTGNFGLRAKDWLDNRSEGLSPNNLLECSGLTSVSLFRAYGVDGVGCSGNWTERANPALFREVTDAEIRPGDFLTKSFGCNSDASNSSGGHVAIAASAPDANGNIIVYETDSWEKPVRFTKKNLSDFPGGHSRYIGTGTQ